MAEAMLVRNRRGGGLMLVSPPLGYETLSTKLAGVVRCRERYGVKTQDWIDRMVARELAGLDIPEPDAEILLGLHDSVWVDKA